MHVSDSRTGVFHTVNGRTREIRIDLLDDAQVEIYRTWTPEQRIEAGCREMLFVRRLLSGVLREEHPDWPEEQVKREVAKRILGEPR
jgi:hypothetical protein